MLAAIYNCGTQLQGKSVILSNVAGVVEQRRSVVVRRIDFSCDLSEAMSLNIRRPGWSYLDVICRRQKNGHWRSSRVTGFPTELRNPPNCCIRLISRIVLKVLDVAFNDIPRFAVETHQIDQRFAH